VIAIGQSAQRRVAIGQSVERSTALGHAAERGVAGEPGARCFSVVRALEDDLLARAVEGCARPTAI